MLRAIIDGSATPISTPLQAPYLPPVMPRNFLIVGGAEKAGTTSLYTYLAAHPAVCASAKKETDHFRAEDADLASYLRYFDDPTGSASLYVESSPAYLAESDRVAPRIASMLPDARLVFVLRDPVDRLRSSFRFYKSRLHVPDRMSFDAFVNACFEFERGDRRAAELGIREWHLKSLQRGRYERLLLAFTAVTPPERLLLVLHDELREDVRTCVQRVARFAGLDPAFFDSHLFTRENVSFLARRPGLQRLAIFFNDRFERLWRRHPALKRRLLAAYKRANERPLDRDELLPQTLELVQAYYAGTTLLLADLKQQSPSARL